MFIPDYRVGMQISNLKMKVSDILAEIKKLNRSKLKIRPFFEFLASSDHMRVR
jgi:hypothetical protein